ncbi:putative transporter [Gordonia effusa NBRC 100432]|uniref:Putative transporter n=1 Tax=Gordonia effusa NBRC 100432 TaxID=1077974 RepID=H0R6A6_9ACTN|nr:SLC13 family permease [Gordonia effusa]GAB20607.1 putative transporter [Gordonia effusa NBRC 100432]
MESFVAQVAPVLVFLLAITVVAEICQHAGVFDAAARLAARWGRGRVWALWFLVVILATTSTAVLSLDTTAVLVTPVVLAMARQAKMPALPFAMVTVWLANTASLLLPVSNLSNLLALHHFGDQSYLALSWRPALAAIGITIVAAALLYRRQLRGRYERHLDVEFPRDHVLFAVACAVCIALVPAFISGLMPAIPAVAAALILLIALWVRDREQIRRIAVPWHMAIAVAALLALMRVLTDGVLGDLVLSAAGGGDGLGALLRLSGVGAASANVVNNLPAYLALESAAADSPVRLMALLIGVNVGPIVTIWGSLATILWRQRCARAGVYIGVGRFVGQGMVVALVAVVVATTVLWCTT